MKNNNQVGKGDFKIGQNENFRIPFCTEWKAQNQIIMISLLLFLIILILVYLLSYVMLSLAISKLEQNSKILIDKEQLSQIKRYNSMQLEITQQYFQKGAAELSRINQIFLQTQKGINITQPQNCIFDEIDSFQKECLYCYGFCNATEKVNYIDYQNLMELSSMLTEYFMILDLDRPKYFTDLSPSQYFSILNSPVQLGFQSHQREWFIDHISQMGSGNEIIVSDPFFSKFGKVKISQTYNLTNLNQELVGVLGMDGDFQNLPKFDNQYVVPTLINYDGDLVISQHYQNGFGEIIKFYDTNVTGYNETDWFQVKQLGELYNSTYLNETIRIKLFNSKINKSLLYSVTGMQNPPFIILLYINDSIYRQDEQKVIHKFYDFQYTMLELSLQTVSIVVGIILILQFIFIGLISKEMRELTKITRININYYGKYSYYVMCKKQNQTIYNLYEAYKSLTRNIAAKGSQRRNVICKYMELIQFPFQSKSNPIDKQLLRSEAIINKSIRKTSNITIHLQKVQLLIKMSLQRLYQGN